MGLTLFPRLLRFSHGLLARIRNMSRFECGHNQPANCRESFHLDSDSGFYPALSFDAVGTHFTG